MKRLISREWVFTTLIVLLGSALCVRLGIWQLDRLEQRRQFNSHVEAMWALPPLSLPTDLDRLPQNDMEYRSVTAVGEYDFASQVALRNQFWNDQFGYHLLTPLIVGEGLAVIIDRGWIPADENSNPTNWENYNDAYGAIFVSGIIRSGQAKPDVGGRPDPTLAHGLTRLDFWNNVNLSRLAGQTPYELLDFYIQLDPVDGDQLPPIPYQPEIELTEGPHLGYAGQWFTFAAILFFGYPFYVLRRAT